MDEERAITVARALGSEVWQSGGDIWLILFRRANGHVVVLFEEAICEYSNEEARGTGATADQSSFMLTDREFDSVPQERSALEIQRLKFKLE